ncbi:Nuclear distribution protein nudE 1 [Podosphaera aphanis]|nr:Nuclear distribution protein nudE 1 [Podosphaera aphanis]
MDDNSSSPTPENALEFYKSQYEQLEHELAEFQASSQELEAELEKDVEAAEKRERTLQDKVESLGFEVDEWKTKYRQSKIEANAAQNTLQKEVTTLRDANRTLQLKLRDIEVQNDDIERQARNTSSSLEDLESKYNVAIERAVMTEEEIKIGEQERESLRIENQRLRDELSDLKIEAEIMQDKLRKRQFSNLTSDVASPSRTSSPNSTTSSPLITTPLNAKSITTKTSSSETPPSPPISEASGSVQRAGKISINAPKTRLKIPVCDSSKTPKPTARYVSGLRNSRGPAAASSSFRTRNATPATTRQTRAKVPATRAIPNSNSLSHIRSLTAQMHRLEQRVQSARSRLPAPISTPTRTSPRNESSLSTYVPSSITIRSRKRISGSTVSTSSEGPINSTKDTPRLSTSGISRLSFGPIPKRDISNRPHSRASGGFTRLDRPLSRSEIGHRSGRASTSGARTPLGHFSQSESHRLRSSFGSSYGSSPNGHAHSQSASHINIDDTREIDFETPTRRSTIGKGDEVSAIPTLNGISRRKSGQLVPLSRRTSTGNDSENGLKPLSRPRKLSDLGESY